MKIKKRPLKIYTYLHIPPQVPDYHKIKNFYHCLHLSLLVIKIEQQSILKCTGIVLSEQFFISLTF